MAQTDDIITSTSRPRKGRGALSNEDSRYSPLTSDLEPDPEAPRVVTECRPVTARSIIARNQSPDIPFEQSINPYQGCEHGCVYCYARPTHAYLDLSPGLDFETRLTYKANAAEQLEKELCKPSYRCSDITLGANTDPYQPVEKTHRITRSLLQVLQQYRHPFTIITKSSLITRDLDILEPMAEMGLCRVAVSVTTLDDELKRKMEPRTASGQARLQVIEQLSTAGVPVSVLFAPVVPALNDREMETLLECAVAAGASSAAYILLRLPLEIRGLFEEWLQSHFPLKAEHVMSLVRQCRGGANYDSRFGHRMRGTGPFAELLQRRFEVSCRKLGLRIREKASARTDLFLSPAACEVQQRDLFS